MVASDHVLDRGNDIVPGCCRPVAEFSRECLNPNLSHRKSFQHCFDGDLCANKWAVSLQIEFFDQVALDKAEPRADISEVALEESLKRTIIDP